MKIIKKNGKLLALSLALLFLFTIGAPSETKAFNDKSKQGVVAVVVYAAGGEIGYAVNGAFVPVAEYEGWLSRGTGFFVGVKGKNPQYIITNHHVVDCYIEGGEGAEGYIYMGTDSYGDCYYSGKAEIRIMYSADDYDVAYTVDYGDTDRIDLALLKLLEPTDKRQPMSIMIPDESMVGEVVYAIGFPANADNTFTDASQYGINDMTVTQGTISRFAANTQGIERIQMDAKINSGNSGGPLVTEEGYVIGVNTNGYGKQGEQDFYSINVTHVVDMLNKNDIEFDKITDRDGSKINIGLIIGIVVAVIAVIAAVVVVVTRKKKVGTAGGTAPRKATPHVAKQQMAVAGTPMVKSLSAQHNGACFAVKSAPILVGRDSTTCAIAYKEGTIGVSGRHCSIAWDGNKGEFIITDLNSSYGTYLTNGQRLQPNMPYSVKPGESFYVGDRSNIIVVEVG